MMCRDDALDRSDDALPRCSRKDEEEPHPPPPPPSPRAAGVGDNNDEESGEVDSSRAVSLEDGASSWASSLSREGKEEEEEEWAVYVAVIGWLCW
mmetsp:Transcript_44523/g.82376  ORF Transcript_44523/g.82376 Transcript_44523/m.82376 type:complete len:95 (+) Transcript_44523:77-361(+)